MCVTVTLVTLDSHIVTLDSHTHSVWAYDLELNVCDRMCVAVTV